MFQYILHLLFLIQYITCSTSTSLQEWLNNQLISKSAPITYIIRLENEESVYPNFQSKRSIAEGIKTDDHSLVTEIVKEINTARQKRTPENATTDQFSKNGIDQLQGLKDIHLKENLRYHHQQRHPNGSISGSYAQIDPNSNQLKVMHYINDERGFREWLERNEPSTTIFDLNQPIKSYSGKADTVINSNIVDPPFNIPRTGGIAPTPILQSAAGSVNHFSPKSPLFDKYYRPSPEEVQKSYEYHLIRNSLDPNSIPLPGFSLDKQPELRSIYSEIQIPYSAHSHENLPPTAYLGMGASMSPNDISPLAPVPTPLASTVGLQQPSLHDPYVRSTPFSTSPTLYPQTLEPQAPVYVQSYDRLPFIPASTYSGPYLPNTATFNQPYPTNIPIYNGHLPQNVPTYSQPAPENVPVYGQPPLPGYGQNIYYVSASNAQPTLVTKY